MSFIRLTVRRKVDFPDPVGPMRAVIVPRLNSMSTFEMTVLAPKPKDTF